MKRRRLLDSLVVLAWTQDEVGAEKARREQTPLLLTVINLGEVYYRIARQHGHPFAQGLIRQLKTLPLELCSCDEDLALHAARIKADYPIAYADAVAAAAAARREAAVVTGDPAFRKVEHLIPIEWL